MWSVSHGGGSETRQSLDSLQKVSSGGLIWLRSSLLSHQAGWKPAEEKPLSPGQSWRPEVA